MKCSCCVPLPSLTAPPTQHNVLWEDLTAKEHMQLFAHLKGIHRKQLKEDVRHLLECVQLDRVWVTWVGVGQWSHPSDGSIAPPLMPTPSRWPTTVCPLTVVV